MDVAVVGSGGREHALGWKLAQSTHLGKLYFLPGNGGTWSLGTNVAIKATDVDGIVAFAKEKSIGLVVIGPDNALEAGLVDSLMNNGIRAFGPTRAAATVESSKAMTKYRMRDWGVPTAGFAVFDDYTEALAHLKAREVPVVIKDSGLALGKGVHVCMTSEEAVQALQRVMQTDMRGKVEKTVVIEDYMEGEEFSAHFLSDGTSAHLFPFLQDHKRIGDGDTGPNTGGMGVVGPLPTLEPYAQSVRDEGMRILRGMKHVEGTPFAGCLYPGFMVTDRGLMMLECNARFGDPECQAYMLLLEEDLLELLNACVDGTLPTDRSLGWYGAGYVAGIVLASAGYPNEPRTGFPIEGLEDASRMDGIQIFHAGTRLESGTFFNSGGRVLNVMARGKTLNEAIARAYVASACITFEGMQYRTDIGRKALDVLHVE